MIRDIQMCTPHGNLKTMDVLSIDAAKCGNILLFYSFYGV